MALDQTRARPRTPGFVYGSITLVMLVVLGVIALIARQPPPPTIAEFAPNAQEQIEDAPEEQAARRGRGAGASPPPTEGGVPTPGPAEQRFIDTPRVRRCVGNPPRQTEDPQSPPCVPYWEGDNGGATWRGVTRNEIKINVPANQGHLDHFLAYFNSRYEFYGRKLVAVQKGGDHEAVKMVAAAQAADAEGVFASTMYGDAGGGESIYYDELARRGIISVDARPSMSTEADLAKHHPYRWSFLPTHDVMQRNEGEWICKALKDRPPEFASGRERTAQTRRFGLVYTKSSNNQVPDLSHLKGALARCGITFTRDTEAEMVHNEGDAQGIQRAQTVVIQMQSQNVTTIICACHTQNSGLYLYPNASKQGYYPEWIIGTYMYQAEDAHAGSWDPAQVENSFGISWLNKQIAPDQSAWYWAIKEAEPGYRFPSGNPYVYYEPRYLYYPMLVLASGIQLAGPNLNPTTFARGLQQARWPNPNAGRAPYWQATIGFGGDHSAVEDGTLVWLTRSQRSNWGMPGATCFAQQGIRYRLGGWPSDNAGLFQPPCY
ncbi:MAG TPA: hypothetical protein VM840_02630 [Actinomycetota bacterium]|nr:hypothetical protein [Actinomycetota bacterium]